jgi:K+-sensing histidine kinase KdpD
MGLGLAVCKSIAESLGAALEFTNHQAGGCTFQFTLPLSRPEKES